MRKWIVGLAALVAVAGAAACGGDSGGDGDGKNDGGGSALSGTVTAPSGGSVAGTLVFACFVQGGSCVADSANNKQVEITTAGASATFQLTNLAAGSYVVLAAKDVDDDGELGPGDYTGGYTTGAAGTLTQVTPPRTGLSVTMAVIDGGTGPTGGAVTFLRPADFSAGATRSASVTLRALTSSERVVVVPVHASQAAFAEGTPDGLAYSIATTGTTAQALPVAPGSALAAPVVAAAALPRTATLGLPPLDLATARDVRDPAVQRDAHLAVLEHGLVGAERLRQRGARMLGAAGTVRAQAMDNCGARTVGQTCNFWVIDDNSTASHGQTQITTTLAHVSTSAYWFLDNETTNALTPAELQAMALRFENEVIPPDRRYFGDFADVDANQKIVIVFSRLLGPQGLLGYVHPLDFFDDAETMTTYDFHSNEGDIFYAATPNSIGMGTGTGRAEYLASTMPSTMVHELKHLIATGRRLSLGRAPEQLWVEEGSAMAAQELANMGSQIDEVQGYARYGLAKPQDFRVLHTNRPAAQAENLSIYGYNFLMLWRAAEVKGHDAFWKAWTVGDGGTTGNDASFVGTANLQRHTGKALPELMLDWAATLLLDNNTWGLGGYEYASLNLRAASWQTLGYTPLTNGLSGAARSMAYHVARGTGADATVTVNVTRGEPYALVVRLPGALPWSATAPEVTVSGTLTAVSGRTVAGSVIVACELQTGSDQCGPKSKGLSVSANSSTYNYSLALQAGTYQFFARQDANGNGTYEAEGCFNGCADTVVSGARTGVNITLATTGATGVPSGPDVASLRPLTLAQQGLLRTAAAGLE